MNPDLSKLKPYPFERLAQLKAHASPPETLQHIALSIGEPKHPAPEFVQQTLKDHTETLANYPSTKGLPELRAGIARWLEQRFAVDHINSESQVLPVNGTREAIFAFTQAVVDRTQPNPLVVCPNPFYQIYEGAAFLAGATPHFLPCLPDHDFVPDYQSVPDHIWRDCQVLFVCSPGNPTGAVTSRQTWLELLELADRFDFILASDECYSEIYPEEQTPSVGLLQVCQEQGRTDFNRCVVFHSLSKRSNLPGLRSGFIAGDAALLADFLLYRTYHGCAMSLPVQKASLAAWADEQHVADNRARYREKFAAVLSILTPICDVKPSDASFYLWLPTPIDDETFAKRLFAEKNVTVLPGSYLSRTVDGINPGANRVRMALVASTDECVEAACRIRDFLVSLGA